MPVDVRKLRRDRAKVIRAVGPDYDERIAGIVSQTADLAFSRLTAPKNMPPAEAAKLGEMVEITTMNGAAYLDLIPQPCDSCLDKLDAYLAQGATLQSSAAAMH
jgi:hypothetical protein